MKTKNLKEILLSLLGLIVLATGAVLIKVIDEPQGIMITLPYICIGIGSGVFGYGIGQFISKKIADKSPDIAKKMEIEQNDERNVALSNKSKAKAYDIMVFVYGALILAFALMQVKMAVTLALIASYLFVIFSNIYYRWKYEKEM